MRPSVLAQFVDSWDSRAKMLTEPEAVVTETDASLALRYLQRVGAEDLAPYLGLQAA